MSLKNDLDNIYNIKNDIKDAIEGKLSNSIDLNFANYSNYINSIPSGIDTSDATATANDILLGQTAYANGVKLFGTYEGSGGSGDVKLFETIEEMQSSTGNQEGDLAVVYRNTSIIGDIENLTANTEFQIGIFPKIVTLSIPVHEIHPIYINFQAVNPETSIYMMDSTLTESRFSINMEINGVPFSIQYSSYDGMRYIRETFEKNYMSISGNEMDFDTAIKISDSDWDDSIGYFIQIQAQTQSTIFDGLFQYENNNFNYAKTQFTVDKEQVYTGIFYSSNGIENGTLQNTRNLSIEQLQIKSDIYSTLSNLSLENNITNLSNLFREKENLITVPNFNTSNVTDMSCMFFVCPNLTHIPNFDTSNVTNMKSMFSGCYNLTAVPNFDTSNVTDMPIMFSGCYNLTEIPNFNTSNVIDISWAFASCYNLTTVPNFDTSNVTNMKSMFSGCYNLTAVPTFNTSNVTNISGMFYSCNNLSNESIQNIVNMCINSNITNSKQMNLSNSYSNSPLYQTKFDNNYYQNRWTELTAAGWTY